MLDRAHAEEWVRSYERSWRREGTDHLATIFTADASYAMDPYETPVRGLAAIGELWEREREGPHEPFTMRAEVLAVEGDVAIVRVEVEYHATGNEFRDLWIVRFAPDGRAASFEEWAFAPPV